MVDGECASVHDTAFKIKKKLNTQGWGSFELVMNSNYVRPGVEVHRLGLTSNCMAACGVVVCFIGETKKKRSHMAGAVMLD